MTLTVELPDTLTDEFRERQIPEQEVQAIVIAALEIWLAERNPRGSGRFSQSAVPFV